jgi:hypothetical protein
VGIGANCDPAHEGGYEGDNRGTGYPEPHSLGRSSLSYRPLRHCPFQRGSLSQRSLRHCPYRRGSLSYRPRTFRSSPCP